ncbi:MAG: glycosyltransferase [Phycisphaeraceae bacterium]|nr:glycosyltransferase [Phycisphaeraceae bacterium]
MNMIRVLHLIQSVNAQAGGTATAFLGLLDALREHSQVHVLAVSTPPPEGDPAWATIRADRRARGESAWTLVKGQGRLLWPGPLGNAARHLLLSNKADLLHIHGLWSPDLLGAAQAAQAERVRYVWQPHGMLVRAALDQKKLKKRVFMALGMRAALERAAAIVYCSTDERSRSIPPAGYPAADQHVIPLPLHLPVGLPSRAQMRAEARRRFDIPADAPTVVFMGRLHHVKRLELAFEAVGRASRTLPNLHLLLLGEGEADYAAHLRALAESLGIAQRVRFAGFISGDDKWPALAAADILTLNSKHENFGFVAVEALCVGTVPVLTDNLALAPELAGVGGGFSCGQTPDDLAAAYIEALRASPRDDVVARGMAWVREHLSAAAVAGSLEGLYRRLLD